jgi:hypothetical protein
MFWWGERAKPPAPPNGRQFRRAVGYPVCTITECVGVQGNWRLPGEGSGHEYGWQRADCHNFIGFHLLELVPQCQQLGDAVFAEL